MKSTPTSLSKFGNIILKKLTTYFGESQEGKGKVLQQIPPTEMAAQMNLESFIRNGGLTPENVHTFLDPYLENSQQMHHPGYMGHQVAVPHIASGMADMIHGVINNPMAIYEMGPSAAVLEGTIVNWMLEKVGWFRGESITDFSPIENNGGGVLTHGGSLANLTALLAARAQAAPNAWEEGNPDDLVVLCPEVSHYSVARAISIMGLGKQAAIPVPVNRFEIMQPEHLQPIFTKVKNEGKRVMAVIANACATSTGLYDPIDEIGQFCNENNLWFHVDGAHGAAALLSQNDRYLLKGIERADSLIWDTHKMLRTTTLCAAVLFKNQKHLAQTFRQKGSYIFHEKEQVGFDMMPYAIECTKAGLGSKLFWVLAAEGEQGLSQFVENQLLKTRQFYKLIQSHPDFMCPYEPQMNILCFQYIKHSLENDHQLAIRNAIIKRGNYYISSAEVNGRRYLRFVLLNQLTTAETIKGLMREIVEVAEEIDFNQNQNQNQN